MIFPLLHGIFGPGRAPFTHFLLILNVLVFGLSNEHFDQSQDRLEQVFTDEDNLKTQGLLFSQFILAQPDHFADRLVQLAKRVQTGDRELAMIMGTFALRSDEFMRSLSTFPFRGDDIAIQRWRVELDHLKAVEADHPSFLWGLHSQSESWPSWITYQFSHSGFMHLAWNMLFLLIMGSFVEVEMGGSFVVFAYLAGGIAGALAFKWASGISHLPLVGASASVSGLLGLIIAHRWSQKLRYFYWLLPTPGYWGLASLPAYLLVFIFVLPDVTGLFSSVLGVGSVAHSAHLGGALCGAMIAGIYKMGWLVKEVHEAHDSGPPNTHSLE